MRKNYAILLVAVFSLMANNLKAQCGLTLSTTATTVCEGSNVTLTATATPPVTSSSLNTTLAGGNNHRGNMFDIYATNTVTITAFDAHPMGNTTIEIYYRTSPYLGFETSSAGWTLIGSAAVTANPFGTATPVPVAVNVTIPAGQTYAFYVTSTNTAVSLNYTDGTSEGATYTSDANITFRQGVGMEYPFSNGGGVFRPRVWNGVIHYSVPNTVTTTYLWNTSATTQSITPTVNSTTQYTVQVDVTGCPTMYDTVNIQVSTPPVNAGPDVAACTGSSVMLMGSGAVSYTWDNSVTDGVAFVPSSTMNYVVTGTDTIGCTATDTVMVTVNSLPNVSAGPDISACAGSQVTLSGSGAVSYTWDNSVMDGVAFTPSSTMDYIVSGTDANNCMNTDTVTVTVNALPVVSAGTDMVVCEGSQVTLSGSGAVSYSWDNGVMDGVAFMPSSTMDYIVTGTDANGCAGMDTITVTVNTVNVAVTTVNETITASAASAAYQWIDCSNNSPLAGETSQSFTATVNGSYAVIVTENGCVDTSACETIISVGIEGLSQEGFSVYPNPSNGKVTIHTGSNVAADLSILDVTGKVIERIRPVGTQVIVDLSAYANGVYFVRIDTGNGVRTVKLIRN